MTRTLAEMIRRLKPRRGPCGLPPVILMTDMVRLPDPAAAVAGLPPGAAVIVRHRDAGARQALVHELRPLCRRSGLKLLVAADAVLAATADGLHLPEAMARRRQRRPTPGWLVTAAAHSPAALVRAAAAGADAALLSPVFATRSHPDAEALGPLRFARMVRVAPLPVYALGGVTRATLPRLSASGAAGVAGIDLFVQDEGGGCGSPSSSA